MKINLNDIDPLFRREMRERWRRPLTYILLSFYVIFLAWISYNLYSSTTQQVPFVIDEGSDKGRQLFITFFVWQLGFWIMAAFLLSAPAIVTERERRSLTELLLAGLSPTQIVYSKFYSLASAIAIITLIPLPVLALCFLLGGLSIFEFILITLVGLSATLASTAAGLYISTSCQQTDQAMIKALRSAIVTAVAVLLLLFVFTNFHEAAMGFILIVSLSIPITLSISAKYCEDLNRFPASQRVTSPAKPITSSHVVATQRRPTQDNHKFKQQQLPFSPDG